MNNQLIEKVIKVNNDACPEFTHSNPLLDRDVTQALAKSFVKILNISQHNTNINNNLRSTILENIRKLCQVEPGQHVKVEENFTETLVSFYEKRIADLSIDSQTADRLLDSYLVRKTKEMGISSNYKSSHNPEMIQALINLNETGVCLDTISQDIIYWDITDRKYLCVLKNLWNHNLINNVKQCDDIAIKMKPEIEKVLLEACQSILVSDVDIENVFSTNVLLKNLIKACSVSPNSFQLSSAVLNYVFVLTNFDPQIQNFITVFVNRVKSICPEISFSVLYPIHLSNVILLLDIDFNVLPSPIKDRYVEATMKHLKCLHKESEYHLILCLSHFSHWFDIYFQQNNLKI